MVSDGANRILARPFMTSTGSVPSKPKMATAGQYSVDTSIYSWGALFRTCYKFTDRSYLYLRRETADVVSVTFTAKNAETDVSALIGEFANELIDQRLRSLINDETRSVRELIVAQAFAEIRTRAAT
jgi:His-Xaa-Ser system protein HxsD